MRPQLTVTLAAMTMLPTAAWAKASPPAQAVRIAFTPAAPAQTRDDLAPVDQVMAAMFSEPTISGEQGWSAPPPQVAPRSAIVVPAWLQPSAPAAVLPQAISCDWPIYRPSGMLSAAAERRRQRYYGLAMAIACEVGVPAALFDALIMRESGYDPTIWSPKLAYGLTQLMPATARGLGIDRFDIVQNLRGGARYLRAQIDRFGAWHLALAAYNAGPGRVRNRLVPRIRETEAYVSAILGNWSRLAPPRLTFPSATGPWSPVRRRIAIRVPY